MAMVGFKRRAAWAAVAMLAAIAPIARAAEHITLANGFELDCVRRVVVGDRVRLYFAATAGSEQNYMEVAANAVVRVETIPDPSTPPPQVRGDGAPGSSFYLAQESGAPSQTTFHPSEVGVPVQPTAAELKELLAKAGAQHNIDAELLAAVVHAESGGQVRAVSRVGAQGLMQLMPETAAALGVHDAFAAGENVEGGTKYLDQMLTRYRDNIALALAAYNAGPGAVDRYHGVPPYRETRAYVARVIREFNRRKSASPAQAN